MFNTKEDFNDYEGFVEKFKPKKTTDDCYTPPYIFEAVKDYVERTYHTEGRTIVRPFFPGGGYQFEAYPEGCLVLDNPPFSILAEIVRFYLDNKIDFFLFAPGLTCLSTALARYNEFTHICTSFPVEYENGAKVPTSFITNLTNGMERIVVESAPELYRALKIAQDEHKGQGRQLTKNAYPSEVFTVSMAGYLSKYGKKLEIRASECEYLSALDEQKAQKKKLFGNGLLLSSDATDRLMDALDSTGHTRSGVEWQLSEREKDIVKRLDEQTS